MSASVSFDAFSMNTPAEIQGGTPCGYCGEKTTRPWYRRPETPFYVDVIENGEKTRKRVLVRKTAAYVLCDKCSDFC